MRKISLVAAIALMLAGVGVWATSTTQARIDVPASAQIDPLQITMGARHLSPVADRVVTDDAPETEPWGPFRTTDW
jgi:hypothetical protein